MKTNFLKLTIFAAFFTLFIGCETLTFGGKSTAKLRNDVAYQTVQWGANSSEADIEREFKAFVRETLSRHRYKNYVQLFQSNYFLDEGERTYVIKIFKNEEAKNDYFDRADDIVGMSIALASNGFRERWSRLESGMIVEDVYELLPELANFQAEQVFYTGRSELRLSDRWLSFDMAGRLLSYGTGAGRTSAPRNEEWVF